MAKLFGDTDVLIGDGSCSIFERLAVVRKAGCLILPSLYAMIGQL